MIRVALQLLAIVAAMGAVVAYGFIRDRQEHKSDYNDKQQSIYFPENQTEEERVQRGAAMSRVL